MIRGRIDAVFAEPGPRLDRVDWKTGAEPRPPRSGRRCLQLAVYRLAWAGWSRRGPPPGAVARPLRRSMRRSTMSAPDGRSHRRICPTASARPPDRLGGGEHRARIGARTSTGSGTGVNRRSRLALADLHGREDQWHLQWQPRDRAALAATESAAAAASPRPSARWPGRPRRTTPRPDRRAGGPRHRDAAPTASSAAPEGGCKCGHCPATPVGRCCRTAWGRRNAACPCPTGERARPVAGS